MLNDEKERLILLLDDERRWCQDAEARDRDGNPVRYDDETATAWDLVGAMCHLFGWPRARQLFQQVCRHLAAGVGGRVSRDPEIAAMTCLQDFNDERSTTRDMIVGRLRGLRVGRSHQTAGGPQGS